MAFTIIADGGRITDKLATFIPEMRVAINQRLSALGKRQITFPYLPWSAQQKYEWALAHLGGPAPPEFFMTETDLYEAYADLIFVRNSIINLIPGDTWNPSTNTYSTNRFLKNDGVSSYANVQEVLTAAGYPGGWDTNYEVGNKGLWVQIQDVFGVLKKYKRTLGGSPKTNGYIYRYYVAPGADPGFEALWDIARGQPNQISTGLLGGLEGHTLSRLFSGNPYCLILIEETVRYSLGLGYTLIGSIISGGNLSIPWYRGVSQSQDVALSDSMGNTGLILAGFVNGVFVWPVSVSFPVQDNIDISYWLFYGDTSPIEPLPGVISAVKAQLTGLQLIMTLDATSGLTYG